MEELVLYEVRINGRFHSLDPFQLAYVSVFRPCKEFK